MPRLFLAVWPTDDVVEELRTLPRKDAAGVRFVPPERWHVTLRFLGEAAVDEVVDAVDAAIDAHPLPPADGVELGPSVDVLAERALVVPVHGLDALAGSLRAATTEVGAQPSRRRFVGHLTLARIKVRNPRFRMPSALGHLVQASFDVEEVALVQSTLRPDGPTYETLTTWPLHPRP